MKKFYSVVLGMAMVFGSASLLLSANEPEKHDKKEDHKKEEHKKEEHKK
jgi:hypothetical protein